MQPLQLAVMCFMLSLSWNGTTEQKPEKSGQGHPGQQPTIQLDDHLKSLLETKKLAYYLPEYDVEPIMNDPIVIYDPVPMTPSSYKVKIRLYRIKEKNSSNVTQVFKFGAEAKDERADVQIPRVEPDNGASSILPDNYPTQQYEMQSLWAVAPTANALDTTFMSVFKVKKTVTGFADPFEFYHHLPTIAAHDSATNIDNSRIFPSSLLRADANLTGKHRVMTLKFPDGASVVYVWRKILQVDSAGNVTNATPKNIFIPYYTVVSTGGGVCP